MKFLFTSFLIGLCLSSFAQSFKKHQLYIHWGWNGSGYSYSDIHFKGDDHNFTLHDVQATDRQSPFGEVYFDPKNLSIPQYNFKIGFFINDKYDIAIGSDHMKYVVKQNQVTSISGTIDQGKYKGNFDKAGIKLDYDFLQFEHTDGLNYVNGEFNRNDNLPIIKSLSEEKVAFNSIVGVGIGALIPRTDATLLGKERHDEFHLAGYGFSLKAGLNVTFFKYFFIQAELKGGFINMPNIRTTFNPNDIAKQNFFFHQRNILFGGRINLGK